MIKKRFTCPNPKCSYSTTQKSNFKRHIHNPRLSCYQPLPGISLEEIKANSLVNPFDKSDISPSPILQPLKEPLKEQPEPPLGATKQSLICKFCQASFSKSYYDKHLTSCSVIEDEIRQVHLKILKLLSTISNFGYEFQKCNGYIYLLFCYTETKKYGHNVFKVGMTTCQPYDRIRRYPGDVQVLKTIATKNVQAIEKIILERFCQTYDICHVLRNEYFSGNSCSMIRIIDEIVHSHNHIE